MLKDIQTVTPKEVQDSYFLIFPTAKNLLEDRASVNLIEGFKPIFKIAVDKNTYPHAETYLSAFQHQVELTYGNSDALAVRAQMEKSFVLNEMVHLGLMRSFDKMAPPFIDEKTQTQPDYNYNTLIYQAEALWSNLNHYYNNTYTIGSNGGMVFIDNETSPGYLQTTPYACDAIKLYASAQKGSIVSYSDLINEKHIDQVKKQSQNAQSVLAYSFQNKFIEEFSSDNNLKYNQKIARLYAQQLDLLFNKTKHINVDCVNVFSKSMLSAIQDETTLFSYIFKNKNVLSFMADSFSGVKSGWSEPDQNGEHSLFVKLKKVDDNCTTAREAFYSYSADEIADGLKAEKILPRTALYFIYNFLEVGCISLGGTAQAPYLTTLKGRMINFLESFLCKMKDQEFSGCPLSYQQIEQRLDKIKSTPTDLPIGGLSVISNNKKELYTYADALAGMPMNSVDMTTLTFQDALYATMPTLVTYKCQKPVNTFKVGAEHITVPHIAVNDTLKEQTLLDYPSKLWCDVPTHERAPT